MTPKEIIEGNKLIAEFMGGEVKSIGDFPNVFWKLSYRPSYSGITIDLLEYHSSWDWLMPVVEKIENCFERYVIVTIKGTGCHITLFTQYAMVHNGIDFPNIDYHHENSKIEAVWLAVVEFIKWYNQQK